MYGQVRECTCVYVCVHMCVKYSDAQGTHRRNNCPLPVRSEDMESF